MGIPLVSASIVCYKARRFKENIYEIIALHDIATVTIAYTDSSRQWYSVRRFLSCSTLLVYVDMLQARRSTV